LSALQNLQVYVTGITLTTIDTGYVGVNIVNSAIQVPVSIQSSLVNVPITGVVGGVVNIGNVLTVLVNTGYVGVNVLNTPNVNIANTPSVLVNTGYVGVSVLNTPSAVIANTVNVTVVNTPSVNIANSLLPITGYVSIENVPSVIVNTGYVGVGVLNTPTVLLGNTANVVVVNTPNVNVVNTPTVNVGNTPLPVTGFISIENVPTVVVQTGFVGVNVLNQPTVTVGNTPLSITGVVGGNVSVVNTPTVTVGNTVNVAVVNTPNVNVANTPTVVVGNTVNVSVVNTPNVNVVNTPNVNVANTPTVLVGSTVNVSVVNTPTVNIGNTPNVNVVNTPSVIVNTGYVGVSVLNTPNVNVANTPNVNVANTPTVNVGTTVNVNIVGSAIQVPVQLQSTLVTMPITGVVGGNVSVVNTPSVVVNTGYVGASIVNTPSVNVANTPTVVVGSTVNVNIVNSAIQVPVSIQSAFANVPITGIVANAGAYAVLDQVVYSNTTFYTASPPSTTYSSAINVVPYESASVLFKVTSLQGTGVTVSLNAYFQGLGINYTLASQTLTSPGQALLTASVLPFNYITLGVTIYGSTVVLSAELVAKP